MDELKSLLSSEQSSSSTQGPGNAPPSLTEVLNAATQVLICATDLHGTITLFNSGAEKMLGYKSSVMIGKQTPEIMHLETEVEKRVQFRFF